MRVEFGLSVLSQLATHIFTLKCHDLFIYCSNYIAACNVIGFSSAKRVYFAIAPIVFTLDNFESIYFLFKVMQQYNFWVFKTHWIGHEYYFLFIINNKIPNEYFREFNLKRISTDLIIRQSLLMKTDACTVHRLLWKLFIKLFFAPDSSRAADAVSDQSGVRTWGVIV